MCQVEKRTWPKCKRVAKKYIYIYHDIASLLVTTTKEHALHFSWLKFYKHLKWRDPHGEDSLMIFWKHSIFTSTTNPRKLLGFTLQTAPKLLDCPHVSYKYTYAVIHYICIYIYILRALHTWSVKFTMSKVNLQITISNNSLQLSYLHNLFNPEKNQSRPPFSQTLRHDVRDYSAKDLQPKVWANHHDLDRDEDLRTVAAPGGFCHKLEWAFVFFERCSHERTPGHPLQRFVGWGESWWIYGES